MSLQAVDAADAAQLAPDVEIRAQVSADEVEIERDGPVSVSLNAVPDDSEQSIEMTRSAPSGQRQYRDLKITVTTEIKLTDPLQRAFDRQETRAPQAGAAAKTIPTTVSEEDSKE